MITKALRCLSWLIVVLKGVGLHFSASFRFRRAGASGHICFRIGRGG